MFTKGRLRRAAPALVSCGLLVWLGWRIPFHDVSRAAALLDWHWLAAQTGILVAGLYLWDTVCLRWLFAYRAASPSFSEVLQARGRSYLWSAFNYEAGQASFAWRMAKLQGTPLATALVKCFLLAAHDVLVLLGLGLAGTLSSENPRASTIRNACLFGLVVLIAFACLWQLMVVRGKAKFFSKSWLGWPEEWNKAASARLCVLRLFYYLLILTYAATAIYLCGLPLDAQVVCGVIPLVLLADALPSVSGLGTRETAMLVLLQPEHDQKATVVGFCLIWSTGLLLGRAGIGLASEWMFRGGGVGPVEKGS